MKNHTVLIPVTGYVSVEVKAESVDEAVDKAYEEASLDKHLEEWDLHEKVVRGNVSYALLNEIEIYED